MSSKKTILVTGANGQLGQSIQAIQTDYEDYDLTFVTRNECNLSSTDSIQHFFSHHHFDVIINCAAYTAVDKAESEPELATLINATAVEQLAQIAKQQQTILIHISTDYVFKGENFAPYQETEVTCPQSVYGDSKLKGEQAIQAINPQGLIIRTSWVYSEYGANFVKTMLRLGRERESLGVIFDQIGTPTYATDLARAILAIVSNPKLEKQSTSLGIYHYSNEGVCSWYDFAKAIFELSAIDCQLNPIETKDYPTPAKRPHYSLLNKAKIKQTFDLTLPYWKDSLQHCLQTLNN
ncbi:MAG: dTDP-4-dehydrorhamnose reductase [Methylococcales bacterium]|nr:dTDP-4-dehydrorhamnose reductase [Methylococcales bacterium]